MTKTATRITEVGRVMVPVSDQDKAIEFYTGKLGFELRADVAYGDGDRWIEVGPPGGQAAIALVPPMEGESAGIKTRVALGTDDIDATHAELLAQGVDVDPQVMRMGDPVPPMFMFRDLDGNVYFVVE